MKRNEELLLKTLLPHAHGATANEIIKKIRRDDFDNRIFREPIHFYTHLNKRFAPLERKGLIKQIGTKKGPSNRMEKVWVITKHAGEMLQSSELASPEFDNLAA